MAEKKHPILTEEQVEKARLNARKRIEKQRLEAAMKQAEEEEVQRLAREEGFTTGIDAKDEIVDVVIDLAPYSDRIIIDGVQYMHARTYSMPRHKADSIREICYRTKMHEHDIKDENLQTFYGRKYQTQVNGKTGVAVNLPPASLG